MLYSAASLLNIFEDSCLGKQLIQFCAFDASLYWLTVCTALENADLEFLSIWLRHVHRFAQHLGSQDSRLLESQVLTVVILKSADCIHTVLARSMGLPGCIVARWVRAVELEALDGVVASVHERDAKGSAASVEGVYMLLICEVANELLDVDRLTLAIDVSLSMKAAHVNQHVCIGDNT